MFSKKNTLENQSSHLPTNYSSRQAALNGMQVFPPIKAQQVHFIFSRVIKSFWCKRRDQQREMEETNLSVKQLFSTWNHGHTQQGRRMKIISSWKWTCLRQSCSFSHTHPAFQEHSFGMDEISGIFRNSDHVHVSIFPHKAKSGHSATQNSGAQGASPEQQMEAKWRKQEEFYD